jgi:hypothetical protein
MKWPLESGKFPGLLRVRNHPYFEVSVRRSAEYDEAMGTRIYLIFKDESFLIGSMKPGKSLLQAINDKGLSLEHSQLNSIIKQVDPTGVRNDLHEILKILLAQGFPLTISSSVVWLNNIYMPVTYSAKVNHSNIHLGKYYFTAEKDLDDQFPVFCRLIDYPPGFMKYFVQLVLNDKGVVTAKSSQGVATLIERALDSNSVFGREETIKFLGYQFLRAA